MKAMPLPNAFTETLRETLDEWSSTQKEIAKATGILASHLSEMKSGRRRCTPEYDLCLFRFLGMEESFWMQLRLHYDMQRVRIELGERIDTEVQPAA